MIAERKTRTRALCLISGGLDSLLAVKVLEEQGIEVVGISFESPFFSADNARKGADQLGIKLIVMDITEGSMALVRNPPHGFGKQMNPCIDCHALMVRKAGEVMQREGFDLLATGEVVNERPMSQNRQSLDVVARESGFGESLLRPLSARLLAPTRPEIEGLVDRQRLLSIEGRSRRPQMALAEKYGITQYMQPAGGCLLTDPAFSKRLRELFMREPNASARDVRMLKLGRHFRFPSGAKAIVGRDKTDNEKIVAAALPDETLIISDLTPGPVVLLLHSSSKNDIEIAASLCASFSDGNEQEIDMALRNKGSESRIKANATTRREFDNMRIG